jgi:hypothetical protein
VFIGNGIQEIYGMSLQYFVVLFSLSVCAGLIGLNLSAGLNSDASIYIFIPLILIPQILFSGVVIEYEKLSRHRVSIENVPLAAELTPVRWAYEALAVTQFRDNRYERLFVDYDQQLSRLSYASNLWIPQVEVAAATAAHSIAAGKMDDFVHSNLSLVYVETGKLRALAAEYSVALDFSVIMDELDKRDEQNVSAELSVLSVQLDTLKRRLQRHYRIVAAHKDAFTKHLVRQLGGVDALLGLQKRYHNSALADMLLNKGEVDKIREANGHLVQIKDPVFKAGTSRWGRAHFYCSRKQVLGMEVSTLWFNTAALWAMNVLLYAVLRLNVLRRAVQYINRLKLRRRAKRMFVLQ